jgi:glutamyl/glutaminyl-tRNA synthetase
VSVARTRFAPTPSGYLHLGNAVHLLVVKKLAEHEDWQIALRIDDGDAARTRAEYVDDIFGVLEWLDVDWVVGPRTAQELRESWSQQHRDDMYRQALVALQQSSAPVYVCACSRTQWDAHIGPGCPQGCTNLDLKSNETSLRMVIDNETDVVLWRRDGIAAYHLASVIDDDYLNVTHVVRGADLRESTRIQRHISQWLPQSRFATAQVFHHRLLEDAAGRKLSKSAGVQARPLPRTPEVREELEKLSSQLLSELAPLVQERTESQRVNPQ